MRVATPGQNDRVVMLQIAGGDPRELWRLSPGDDVFDLSPDGRRLVISRRVTASNRDLFTVDLTTGKETMLASGPLDDFWPLWTPDGRAIVFVSDRLAGNALMLLKVSTGSGIGDPIVLRPFGREQIQPIAFGPDGALYVMVTPGIRTVFMATVDLDRGVVGAAHAVDRGAIEDTMGADWSPDGERIAYLRARQMGSPSRSGAVVVRGTDSGTAHEFPLLNWIPLTRSEVRWSPDGKHLAVVYGGPAASPTAESGAAGSTVFTIDIFDAVTGSNRREVISGPFIGAPRWDATGRALYYLRGSGVFRHDLSTNQSTEVYRLNRATFTEAGFDLLPADGSMALSVGRPGGCILSILEPSGVLIERQRFEGNCWAVAWARDGRRILMSTLQPDGLPSLWSLDRSAGDPVRLPIEAPMFHKLSLSPDGRRLLFAAGNPRPNLWKLTGIPTVK